MIREPEPGLIRYRKIYVYADTVHAARYYAAKDDNFAASPDKYIEYSVFLRRCSAGKQQQPTARGGTI